MTAAETAADLIADDTTIGLGSGRAATAFVEALGRRVAKGLRVRGVPTSEATGQLATKLNIPLATLDEVAELALTVDGADEVDPHLNLIKGLGGALIRERVVAASSGRLIILVGMEKIVSKIGSKAPLPVEVVRFATIPCQRKLEAALKCQAVLRLANGVPYVTDNGNHILDCKIGPTDDLPALANTVRDVPGVVGHGLFLGMAEMVVVDQFRQAPLVFRKIRQTTSFADRFPWKK